MRFLFFFCFALGLLSCSTPKPSDTNTSMKNIEIQLIRNATLRIQYAGKMLLVDPMLGPKASFMSFVEAGKDLNPTIDLPIALEAVTQDVDAVLLTHPHLDHFDGVAKDTLDKALPIFVQPSDAAMVSETGFTSVSSVADSARFGDITIHRTTGKHAHDPKMAEALGQVSGFVLQAPQHPTVYLVGDCVLDDTVKAQIAQYQPDIIVTNSGGAVLSGLRILMDEAETVAVGKQAKKATIVATHMEALDHCKVTRGSLTQASKQAGITVLTPKDGEKLSL